MSSRIFPVGLAALLVAAPIVAQPVLDERTEIDFDRPEAWAMKYFASVSLPSAFGAPDDLAAGTVEVALEYVQVPSLDEEQRRVGFGGIKDEDLNKTSYVFRPAVRVGLGSKLSLAASWVPPVDRNGAKANIFALALERPVVEGEAWRLGLRLQGQSGTVEGDFTCSRSMVEAGDDPELNPFGCESASRDVYDLTTLGLEASIAWKLGPEQRWEPFAALSYNLMDLEFAVNARFAGLVDRSKLVTDGSTLYGLLGLGYRPGGRWRVAAEVFVSPLDVVRPPSTTSETDGLVNFRMQLRYGLF